mgnify:FL=1
MYGKETEVVQQSDGTNRVVRVSERHQTDKGNYADVAAIVTRLGFSVPKHLLDMLPDEHRESIIGYARPPVPDVQSMLKNPEFYRDGKGAEMLAHIKGHPDQVYYEYEGGSGGSMKMGFCPKCYVRVSARPEILEGVVGMPLGTFDKAKEVEGLKLEIWTSEKLKFLKDNDCFEMRVEDSGLMERLATLIESVENR